VELLALTQHHARQTDGLDLEPQPLQLRSLANQKQPEFGSQEIHYSPIGPFRYKYTLRSEPSPRLVQHPLGFGLQRNLGARLCRHLVQLYSGGS